MAVVAKERPGSYSPDMRSVGIKALKNGLSEYIRAVSAGETVLVTDRDRVVAEIVPPRKRGALTDEEVIALGVREGWITPAKNRGPLPPPADLPHIPLETLLADLAKDREDR